LLGFYASVPGDLTNGSGFDFVDFDTKTVPEIGSDQGYPRNEEKLLPSIWHGFQGRSLRNKKRGSILMLLYLPFPRHGKKPTFSAK